MVHHTRQEETTETKTLKVTYNKDIKRKNKTEKTMFHGPNVALPS